MQRKLLIAEIAKRRRICVVAAAIILIKNEENKRKRRPRSWVQPINENRDEQGYCNNIIPEMKLYDAALFFNFTRMCISQFNNLLCLVESKIKKEDLRRKTIPPGARLAITLRYLSTGDSLPSLADSFKIGKSTTCRILKETCDALCEVLTPIYLQFPSTPEEWKTIANGYREQWNLPHCIGAIDGKHVVIQSPNKRGSQYFNYKKNCDIVLFAVCDANYKFTYLDIGAYDSQSDSGILRESSFGHNLFENVLNLPDSDNLPSTNIKMPYYFVGDETFPLHNNLLRPYGGNKLRRDKRIFNNRLSRARGCIENAFGILVSRFRIFHRVINANEETVVSIIKATICLHNYIKTTEEQGDTNKNYCHANYVDRYDCEGNLIYGEWRTDPPQNVALANTSTLQRKVGDKKATKEAEVYRNKFNEYLNSDYGSVPWQHSII